MADVVKIDFGNKKEIYELNKYAKQAAGSAWVREGDAVVLATVSRDDEQVDEDFLPLTVQYIEKSYAAAKIPGGFIKRETKPSDFETLTSRIIDRSLRPLFPKGYAYPTQIVVFVLSSDPEVDLQVLALNAASVALTLSDLPIEKEVVGVRVGRTNGEFIINPTNSQLERSTLDLYVAGTKDELLMIEMRSIASDEPELIPTIDDLLVGVGSENIVTIHKMNELSNEEMIEAIEIASEFIFKSAKKREETLKSFRKKKLQLELKKDIESQELYNFIEQNYIDKVKDAITQMAKSERAVHLQRIAEEIVKLDISVEKEWNKELIEKTLDKYKRTIIRAMILQEGRRADGRGLKDVRQIDIETNILPSVHSSCLFTRGQTQALVTLTLGNSKDAQMYDRLTSKDSEYENFMVHYNFPGFSVGEASPLRAPGRRELGHGNLAKRALEPSLELDSDTTVRLVSEILESNGSSSMATVCGGSLALKAAGLETTKLVAGVAMGLIVEGDKKAILTDIMGLEDHNGDMDFKVTGSRDGITAMQMDIKLGGIDNETLKDALNQAKEAREHILSIMEEAEKNIVLNENALPSAISFHLDPSTFGSIIGQAGKTIKEIIERFEVAIDLDRDSGKVKVEGNSKEKCEAAKEHIIELSKKKSGGHQRREKRDIPHFSEGKVFDGKVVRIAPFGAFVELPGGIDGLLHISKLSDDRVEKVTDVVNEGDRVKVKILSQKGEKVELALIEKL
jgi:polyribonucleotide nucleotidyltransferase